MTEDEVYELIDKELNGGSLVRSLWTRVYADADGDDAKAKARYIKERAAQLTGSQISSATTVESKAVSKREFVIAPNSLTTAQFAELETMKKGCAAFLTEANDRLPYILAGASLSDGGREKILGILRTSLNKVIEAAGSMPEEFNLSTEFDVLWAMKSSASMYLFVDMYRHRTPKPLFSKQSPAGLEFDDLMDRTAWTVSLWLKLAETHLMDKK
jgi:hypothetical protein